LNFKTVYLLHTKTTLQSNFAGFSSIFFSIFYTLAGMFVLGPTKFLHGKGNRPRVTMRKEWWGL